MNEQKCVGRQVGRGGVCEGFYNKHVIDPLKRVFLYCSRIAMPNTHPIEFPIMYPDGWPIPTSSVRTTGDSRLASTGLIFDI